MESIVFSDGADGVPKLVLLRCSMFDEMNGFRSGTEEWTIRTHEIAGTAAEQSRLPVSVCVCLQPDSFTTLHRSDLRFAA